MPTKIGTVIFTGASGTEYVFDAYLVDTGFSLSTKIMSVDAVFFVTRHVKEPIGDDQHYRIYVGETGELPGSLAKHPQIDCILNQNPNCICIHPEDDEVKRKAIVADLIEAYHPPCNP